jgi:hypothetical protein
MGIIGHPGVQVIMTNHNNNNPDGRVEECKLKGDRSRSGGM